MQPEKKIFYFVICLEIFYLQLLVDGESSESDMKNYAGWREPYKTL